MADTEGKWRPVSNVGAESYADALGEYLSKTTFLRNKVKMMYFQE